MSQCPITFPESSLDDLDVRGHRGTVGEMPAENLHLVNTSAISVQYVSFVLGMKTVRYTDHVSLLGIDLHSFLFSLSDYVSEDVLGGYGMFASDVANLGRVFKVYGVSLEVIVDIFVDIDRGGDPVAKARPSRLRGGVSSSSLE